MSVGVVAAIIAAMVVIGAIGWANARRRREVRAGRGNGSSDGGSAPTLMVDGGGRGRDNDDGDKSDRADGGDGGDSGGGDGGGGD